VTRDAGSGALEKPSEPDTTTAVKSLSTELLLS
jgi:hypothetical protein